MFTDKQVAAIADILMNDEDVRTFVLFAAGMCWDQGAAIALYNYVNLDRTLSDKKKMEMATDCARDMLRSLNQ